MILAACLPGCVGCVSVLGLRTWWLLLVRMPSDLGFAIVFDNLNDNGTVSSDAVWPTSWPTSLSGV